MVLMMAFEGSFSLEKEMATHSRILPWRILWMEDPGGLPSVGSHRVERDRSNLAFNKTRQCTICLLYQTAFSVECQWHGFAVNIEDPSSLCLLCLQE